MKHTMKLILLALIVICLTAVPVTAKADSAVPVPTSSDTFASSLSPYTPLTSTDFELKYAYIPKDETNGWSKNLLIYYIHLNTGENSPITYNRDSNAWNYFMGTVNINAIAAKSESAIISDCIEHNYPYFWVDEIPTHTDEVTSSSSHTHNWVYGIIYDATEDTDGLEGEYCLCGATQNTSVIPAGDVIISNNYAKIDAAKPGQSIVLDMKTMCNLSQTFMKKLASKNNCSFTIKLKYLNKSYEFYVPAGTSFNTDLEYYGPEKLMEMFE